MTTLITCTLRFIILKLQSQFQFFEAENKAENVRIVPQ